MNLKLRGLHADFGVEVLGVDLSQRPDDDVLAHIEMAADRHSLVLFRDQVMDDSKQLDLTRWFGEPEFSHVAYGRDGRIEYVAVIGNVDAEGRQLPSTDKKVVFGTGNEMWHSDSSFRPTPTKFSLSLAHEVTPEGGELEFVSTRAAYTRLHQRLKQAIADLTVIHDYVYSRSQVGRDVVSPSLAASLPAVPQKLVRSNPVTGEKSYYVGSHARSIEGWGDEDGRGLIDDLIARAVRPENIYQHRWKVGDLLIWDNRCLLHRGRPYDADRYRRRMHQTRVAGVSPTLEEDQRTGVAREARP